MSEEIDAIQRQIDELDTRISNTLFPSIYDIAERNALQAQLTRLEENAPSIIDIEYEPAIEYVKVTGFWQISTEIDSFTMYLYFRGYDANYYSLAVEALFIYFAGTVVTVLDDSAHPFEVDYIPRSAQPSWSSAVFDSATYAARKETVAPFEMSQVEPVERHNRGIRRNVRRYSDFESGSFGFA